MEIQEYYGSKPATELGLIQQEFLTAKTEILKQQGIAQELLRVLANMKKNAIAKKYPNVKVLHNKYGACDYEWRTDTFNYKISLCLYFYVNKIPKDGLSKNDKVLAGRFNNAYNYEQKSEINYYFKSFKERLVGHTEWVFDINDMTSDSFLEKGLICTNANSPFTIILES